MLHAPSLDSWPELPTRPRVAVLASGAGSTFEAIAQSVQAGHLQVTLACLLCNVPQAGALRLAQARGVEALCLPHQGYASRSMYEQALLEALRARQVEWIVMAGWMRVVTTTLLDAFEGRVLNVHPSLLPSFRGAHAIEDALAAGVKITGCTIHHVVPELDAGPILAQAAVPVLESDDVSQLRARIQAQERWLYPRAIAHAIARTSAQDSAAGLGEAAGGTF